jgi:uncharacterized protein YecE (DUF72 family)
MAGTLYVGTSGFAYPAWRGSFYPADLRVKHMLAYYAGRFRSVEINYTFRRHPTNEAVSTWRESVPEGFVFALKAHQRITHWARLGGADEQVSRFLDTARLLGAKLGPILIQCPPTLRYDRALLESFLGNLPRTLRYAFEFRHPSWEEARPMVRDHGAAWCVAETDDWSVPEGAIEQEPFVYLRLRRTRYGGGRLATWARRIALALADGSDVFCYFKHEEGGAGPRFAERLTRAVRPG